MRLSELDRRPMLFPPSYYGDGPVQDESEPDEEAEEDWESLADAVDSGRYGG